MSITVNTENSSQSKALLVLFSMIQMDTYPDIKSFAEIYFNESLHFYKNVTFLHIRI